MCEEKKSCCNCSCIKNKSELEKNITFLKKLEEELKKSINQIKRLIKYDTKELEELKKE